MGVPVSPEDMKKSEKAIREYGIDLKSIKIISAYDIEDLGGLKISMDVLKPVKILGNIIPTGSTIVYKKNHVTYIGFQDEKARFKLNGAVCKKSVSLVSGELCQCHIAEDLKFAKDIIISPPAEVSFKYGKPELFIKAKSWELAGKSYAPGVYVLRHAKLESMSSDVAENYIPGLCIPLPDFGS